jgi:hypothetical protein
MCNVRLRIQVDFGVGDVIVPGPRMIEYPGLTNRFSEVIDDLRQFAVPMFRCIVIGEKLGKQWSARKGWLVD